MNGVNDSISKNDVAKYSLVSAAIAGTATAAKNVMAQKKILANPDVYIKQFKGEIESQKKFHNSFFDGTQDAAKIALDKLDKSFDQFKKFATGGKLNIKQIAKKTGIVAALAGAVVAGTCLLYNAKKDELRDDSKIVAQELKNAKVGEN